MKIFLVVLAFFSAYGADSERLEKIKAIAAPLFIEGMREYDREAIIDSLSQITDYKTENKTYRSFEDMQDIVARALAVCPNIIPSSPLTATFGRDDIDTPETLTGLARMWAVGGFADSKPETRYTLTESAKSLFDGEVDDFLVCNALANLQEFEDLSLRAELIGLAKKHSLPNNLRVRVVGILGDIEVFYRADYDRILGLMTRVYKFLGKEWPQDGSSSFNLYGVMHAIAKNITDESLQGLMDDTQNFLGKRFHEILYQASDNFNTCAYTFGVIGNVPITIRDQFMERVKRIAGTNNDNHSAIHAIDMCAGSCQTLEALDECFALIKPVLCRAQFRLNALNIFNSFRNCKTLQARQTVTNQILDLAADPEMGIITDKKLLEMEF